MKFKKQKRHRRAVRFYTACFGFRVPFKILCDGTFVHHMLVNKIIPADTALSNTLSAPVKIFTTRCVLAELKGLGSSFSESLIAAENLVVARCDHENPKLAADCLIDVIGESNTEHFFVATQDAKLRKKFEVIPGVPLIYGLLNSLFLEQPSTFQHQFARSAEEARSRMTETEFIKLKMKNIVSSTDGKAELPHANEIDQIKVPGVADFRKDGRTKDTVRFKHNRAKGPNPLSCKKKKTTHESTKNHSSAEERSDGVEGSRKQKNRKRKRSNKSKDNINVMEATS